MVDKKLLPSSLIESLQNGKRLREQADYYDDWSKEGAQAVIAGARRFLKTTKEILSK